MEGQLEGLTRAPSNKGPILKLLLICGYRFADQQVAACGSTTDGCWEHSRSIGGPSEYAAITPCP